jgi:hypothetical protein
VAEVVGAAQSAAVALVHVLAVVALEAMPNNGYQQPHC